MFFLFCMICRLEENSLGEDKFEYKRNLKKNTYNFFAIMEIPFSKNKNDKYEYILHYFIENVMQ